MSDKPRVYQGVRVKTTVKELLQRHRAREANSKKDKPTPSSSPPLPQLSQARLELQELCASTFTGRYLDPPTAAPPPAAAAPTATATPPAVDARAPQMCAAAAAALPSAGSSCGLQMQDGAFADLQQQFGDQVWPAGGGPCGGHGGLEADGYAAAAASPWCHGLSSDADYYGPAMAGCPTLEVLRFCSPAEPSCCSPQDSFSSSSSSSCYSSPARMEGGYERVQPPPCSLQDCYCLSPCWPAQQEAFCIQDYAPYYAPSQYPSACPWEENYFRSSEMCYNALS